MKTDSKPQNVSPIEKTKKARKLKWVIILFTLLGLALFCYFVYSVGVSEIVSGVSRIGWLGFLVILFIYLLRISVRATAWRMSIHEPYELRFRDTFPAVIIGEALSSMIPLGILMSGTAKALAVRKKVPLVVGLSSVATENLFYSLTTGLFLGAGALAFLRQFELPQNWVYLLDFVIGFILVSIIFGVFMVIRQWHWASGICEWLYSRNILTGILDSGRLQVRLFENLIYGFYRRHPKRFFPICFLQILFHALGVLEVWFILSRIGPLVPQFATAFFLETTSRLITIVFKLIPFLLGVDEAGAELVVKTLGVTAGIGVTLAIVRKGRILFWAAIGMILIMKRGLSFSEINKMREEAGES